MSYNHRVITYCTNIHPAECWKDVFAALRGHIPAIRSAVSPDQPFPIGLRLSNLASHQIDTVENNRFREWLREHDCFVPTINGFPYGSFHGERIKEKVYLPDWRSQERTRYTTRIADLLSDWLPNHMTGSISTVPLGFKGAVGSDDLPAVMRQLYDVLAHLAAIHDATGKEILLALEPEPGCLLETTDEVCRFFDGLRLPEQLRRHLAVCYDCCHQAVEFETPAESIAKLDAAGVRIAKVQISSSLSVTDAPLSRLAPFAEPSYLHQVVIRRRDGTIARYDDLQTALGGHRESPGDEWRCHFHLPIFLEGCEGVDTTRSFLCAILPCLPDGVLLEIETYTWDVLPKALRSESVTDSIVREISWLKEQLNASHCCP